MTTNKFIFLKDDFQEEQSEETVETATLKPKPSESKPPSTETATISNKKEPKKAEVKEDKTDKTGKRNNQSNIVWPFITMKNTQLAK